MNQDGRLSGEGDVLLPFYDGRYTTLSTQLGARSMDVDGGEDDGSQRWIGNFGLGQRWFPLAEDLDNAGNLMLGYNVFFDNDFTRSHRRGGAGLEAQYDWFHVVANYYTPLSGWKASRDFDGDFVEERPARGWDARLKAYLPFYRNVALTGAYAQWYGDHVAMYGSSDDLEKDPKVWSYGVEYTPVPLVSGFVKQRSTERGKTDTEFGLQFTYHFNMPWDEQISHAKVAELRSVSGSRHEFVDRENRIILEYRAKNAYMVEYLGPNGGAVNEFVFRIRNGFDEYQAGQTVRVTASGVTLAAASAPPETSLLARLGGAIADFFSTPTAHAADFSQSYTTDGQGRFIVRIGSSFAGPVALRIQAGDNSQSFTVNMVANLLSITTASPLPDAVNGTAYSQTFAATGGTAPYSFAVTGGALPAGLALNNGKLEGTPTADGLFTFTVTATDSAGPTAATDSKKFNLTVGAASVYSLEQTPLVSLPVGTPVSTPFVLQVNNIPVADGTSVSLSYSGAGTFDSPPASATVAGGRGGFSLNLKGKTGGGATVTAAWNDGGAKSASCTLAVGTGVYTLDLTPTNGGSFSGKQSTGKVSATLLLDGNPAPNKTITWNVTGASNNSKAVVAGYKAKKTGLAWGTSAPGTPENELTTSTSSVTNASGVTTISLTDVMGEREIKVQATAEGLMQTATISFPNGPLAVFAGPPKGTYAWGNNTSGKSTSFPAANQCGASDSDIADFPGYPPANFSRIYVSTSKLPTMDQLEAVGKRHSGTDKGAAYAAGWPVDSYYWTGSALVWNNLYQADYVDLRGIGTGGYPVDSDCQVVCLP